MITTRPADYRNEVHSFIIGQESNQERAYFDTATPRRATIGYGFNIEVRGYLLLALNELGILNGRTTDETNAILDQFAAVIDSTPDGNDGQLRTNLDALTQFYGAQPFTLGASQSDNVFYNILGGATINGIQVVGKEQSLDTIIADAIPHNSQEYVALMSLFYNSESLIFAGSKLATAIINGNRAEAWYEIRYNSNADNQHANRRYKESDLFGLYNDITQVPVVEAKGVLQMYTTHRQDILNYENNYSPTNPNAGSLAIKDKLVFADRVIIDSYVTQPGIGVQIQEAQGRVLIGTENADTTTLTGSDQNDLILGESGNDTIDGGAGSDVLYGGSGNDTLHGGTENDYLFGEADTDTLYGDDGNDVLEGGAEVDYLYGGIGSDNLRGGAGGGCQGGCRVHLSRLPEGALLGGAV